MEILWNVPTHDSRCNVRQVNIILDISNERQRFENWFEFKVTTEFQVKFTFITFKYDWKEISTKVQANPFIALK